jgi:antibiotic biosynthesis monooxygenase (ABM) superfamily enzyme
MRYGYYCEECEEAAWPVSTRSELDWLLRREHIVREVARHVQNGLDSWMSEALEFLEHHRGHAVLLTRKN